MKTAISLPDAEFERNERVARRCGMNRSEFYRLAAAKLVESMENTSELTAQADAVLARNEGSGAHENLFLLESERLVRDDTQW